MSIMSRYDPIRMGIVPCSCGRLSNKIHCAHCGCYDIRGLAKENTRTMQGQLAEQVKFRVYRCKRCFNTFDDWEWQNECHAPYFESKQAKVLREAANRFVDNSKKTRKMVSLKVKTESPLKEIVEAIPALDSTAEIETAEFVDLEVEPFPGYNAMMRRAESYKKKEK